MTKICFYAHADRLYYYVPMAQIIDEKCLEYDYFFIVDNNHDRDYIQSFIKNARIYVLFPYLEQHSNIPCKEERMLYLQDTYEDVSIWRMLYTDRFLINYSKDDVEDIIINHFAFFEDTFKLEKPNYLLGEAVSTFASYVAVTISKKMRVEYIGSIIDRTNPYNYFFAFDNPMQLSHDMEIKYLENKFDSDIVKKSKEYYENFLSKDNKPAYMNKDVAPKLSAKCVLACFSYINRLICSKTKKHSNKYDYIEYNRPWNDRIYMDFERYIRFKMSKKYYREPDYHDNYYLFTLHFQPEATTLVCAEKYEKQIVAIDHIAKSIPFGTVLYVKEHYACLGHRKLEFYKQLKSYPNVKLISPFVNIHELIRRSKAVIVLTSTTGFEALLHKKKVFVMGDVFYQYSKNVSKINDIYDEWQNLLDTSVDDSDEEVIRFLCSYFSVLKRGNILYGSENFDSKENFDSILNSYLEIMTLN